MCKLESEENISLRDLRYVVFHSGATTLANDGKEANFLWINETCNEIKLWLGSIALYPNPSDIFRVIKAIAFKSFSSEFYLYLLMIVLRICALRVTKFCCIHVLFLKTKKYSSIDVHLINRHRIIKEWFSDFSMFVKWAY